MHRRLPDYLQPGLKVVFVGFNPGERSARIGHYYAGRGNQFWNLLYESGLVRQRLRPEDDHRILEFGLGLTDVVKRWSRSSSSLRAIDYKKGIPAVDERAEWQVDPRGKAQVFPPSRSMGEEEWLTNASYLRRTGRWRCWCSIVPRS